MIKCSKFTAKQIIYPTGIVGILWQKFWLTESYYKDTEQVFCITISYASQILQKFERHAL